MAEALLLSALPGATQVLAGTQPWCGNGTSTHGSFPAPRQLPLAGPGLSEFPHAHCRSLALQAEEGFTVHSRLPGSYLPIHKRNTNRNGNVPFTIKCLHTAPLFTDKSNAHRSRGTSQERWPRPAARIPMWPVPSHLHSHLPMVTLRRKSQTKKR